MEGWDVSGLVSERKSVEFFFFCVSGSVVDGGREIDRRIKERKKGLRADI